MKKVKYARIYNYDRTGNLKYNGTAQIYIRAYLDKRSKYFPTKISVTPKQWDKKNRCIINHPLQVRYNQAIRDLESKIENFELKLSLQGESLNLERLGDYDNEVVDISFTDFYLQQMENSHPVSYTHLTLPTKA